MSNTARDPSRTEAGDAAASIIKCSGATARRFATVRSGSLLLRSACNDGPTLVADQRSECRIWQAFRNAFPLRLTWLRRVARD